MNNYNCLKQTRDTRVLSVLNYGAFIANIYGTYYYNGEPYVFKYIQLSVLQEFRINIPVEATNIHLEVTVLDLFRSEYNLFTKDYDKADDYCFLLWGLSFVAQYKQIPCTSPEMLKDILPQAAIIPYEYLNQCCNPCCCDDPCLNRCYHGYDPCCYDNPCLNRCHHGYDPCCYDNPCLNRCYHGYDPCCYDNPCLNRCYHGYDPCCYDNPCLNRCHHGYDPCCYDNPCLNRCYHGYDPCCYSNSCLNRYYSKNNNQLYNNLYTRNRDNSNERIASGCTKNIYNNF